MPLVRRYLQLVKLGKDLADDTHRWGIIQIFLKDRHRCPQCLGIHSLLYFKQLKAVLLQKFLKII